MAIGLLFELPGMTREQYDGMIEASGFADSLPPGQIFHVAGPMEGGWRVTDVWESREHFDRFAQETLAPLMGGNPPEPQEFEVHAYRV
ncbi:MAG TPA: hypothetical protein VJT75_16665 [Thermoleophilaceae bacterium]|nr:hypothetical protein [Thermoleophilaceae bacterium]